MTETDPVATVYIKYVCLVRVRLAPGIMVTVLVPPRLGIRCIVRFADFEPCCTATGSVSFTMPRHSAKEAGPLDTSGARPKKPARRRILNISASH